MNNEDITERIRQANREIAEGIQIKVAVVVGSGTFQFERLGAVGLKLGVQPHLSILFDRSIESHLSADAIWGLVNLVSKELLKSS